ncbi:MAG TPA: 30S ribosome-binding factor RbfA [Puia sp.]|nr:30S ribosome-binding factor RbfA [Puia sp.]
MQEGKRQKQVAGLLHEELSSIFQKLGLNIMEGGLISVSSVKITPDLFEAKVYISMLNVKDTATALKKIEDRAWEIKKELVSRVKHQLRSMPQLNFFLDDTLEYVDKIEALLKKINPPAPEGE